MTAKPGTFPAGFRIQDIETVMTNFLAGGPT
jgi:hypothetical protein